MCRSRIRRAAALAVIAALAVMTIPAAARSQDDDQVLDLVLTVVSLDDSVSTSESERDVAVTLAADVLFAFDSATLSGKSRSGIDEAAARIRRDEPTRVRVEGHTDSKGSDAYNQRLSERRAGAVVAALRRRLGAAVPPLQAVGRGEADPIASNTKEDGTDDPRARARNRRVTVRYGR